MQLSEALYPSLQVLEVSLRNAIHTAATVRYGTEFWFDEPDALLHGQCEYIQGVKDKLRNAGKSPTAGRIVAGLMFGFWTTLLNRPYERPVSPTSQNRLGWHDANNTPTLLRAAFPYLTKRFQTLGPVWRRCEDIRMLRNRVFHYEAVWSRPYLPREHHLILDTIGWISPDMRKTVRVCDRFPDVFRAGTAGTERKLRLHLGFD